MLIHRLKILAGMIIALIIVESYSFYSKNPEAIYTQTTAVKGLLSNIKFSGLGSLLSFRLNFNNNEGGFTDPNKSFGLPSYGAPTPTEIPLEEIFEEPEPIMTGSATSGVVSRPTVKPQATAIPTVYKSPTPKPTKVPKPTAVPALPPITSDTRPGSSLAEIFQEVSKRACIPSGLLMAFKVTETGQRFTSDKASSIKIYNTYGWWDNGSGDPCYGYGYHTQTGIVPQDSMSAGSSCNNAVGDPTDIGIMGILQISEEVERVTRKYTTKTLPKNIDRRVLFDNALIFAIATRNRVGNPPKDCNNWPDDAIKTAAEKHHGVCVYDYGTGNAGNYCTQILKLYKQYN